MGSLLTVASRAPGLVLWSISSKLQNPQHLIIYQKWQGTDESQNHSVGIAGALLEVVPIISLAVMGRPESLPRRCQQGATGPWLQERQWWVSLSMTAISVLTLGRVTRFLRASPRQPPPTSCCPRAVPLQQPSWHSAWEPSSLYRKPLYIGTFSSIKQTMDNFTCRN